MKIAVTISGYRQVSDTKSRDWNVTKVFDSSDSLDNMLGWAKSVKKDAVFHDMLLSVVERKAGE